MSTRQKQVDAVLRNEAPVSEKSEELVTEQELGLMGIDIGNGNPLAVGFENTSGDDGMDVRVPLQR